MRSWHCLMCITCKMNAMPTTPYGEKVNLIFPHQLFPRTADNGKRTTYVLVEEELFYRYYPFHKQKLVFHRASMKAYEDLLRKEVKVCLYIEAIDELSDVRLLIGDLAQKGVKELVCYEPEDDWLKQRIESSAASHALKCSFIDSLLFLNGQKATWDYFGERSRLSQADFYMQQRKQRKILLTKEGKPQGGKWSLDSLNRKKYPADKQAPVPDRPSGDRFYNEAVA